jgi:hypothetical protein
MNLAFVLLADAKFPTDKDVAKAFGRFAHGQERLVPEKGGDLAKGGALQFQLSPGGPVMIAAMPGPVPNGEADAAAATSVSSFGTGWKLPHHKTHLAVVLAGPDVAPSMGVLSAFTSFLAAVASATNAVGIYWAEAGATHDSKFFTGIARERDEGARMMLWTGLSIGSEPDGRMSLLSLGMKQLQLPDLLLVAQKSAGNAALGTFFDFLGFLARFGKPLPEGDTVGRSAQERLPVRYVPSPIDATTQVWRVELP